MNTKSKTERIPPVHPGQILLTEFLEPEGISQYRLAQATGLPDSCISDLVKARRDITPDSAIRLGKAFGTGTNFWLNLQSHYDIRIAQASNEKEYDAIPLLSVSFPTKSDLKAIVNSSLEKLSHLDAHLLDVDANERSISHRLAIYIQEALPEWVVDCEYNRIGNSDKPKFTNLPVSDTKTDDLEARTVFPDIIVHHRGPHENLLVIEIKKSSNHSGVADVHDRRKLESYCRLPLGYRHGLFLKIRTDSSLDERWEFVEWFPNEER